MGNWSPPSHAETVSMETPKSEEIAFRGIAFAFRQDLNVCPSLARAQWRFSFWRLSPRIATNFGDKKRRGHLPRSSEGLASLWTNMNRSRARWGALPLVRSSKSLASFPKNESCDNAKLVYVSVFFVVSISPQILSAAPLTGCGTLNLQQQLKSSQKSRLNASRFPKDHFSFRSPHHPQGFGAKNVRIASCERSAQQPA